MKTYPFALRMEGVAEEDFDAFADAFFDPELDATPSLRSGVLFATFRIDSESFRDAIRDAIEHVHKVSPAVRVVAVEAVDGLTLDEAFAA